MLGTPPNPLSMTRSIRLRPWQKAAFDAFTTAPKPDFLAVARKRLAGIAERRSANKRLGFTLGGHGGKSGAGGAEPGTAPGEVPPETDTPEPSVVPDPPVVPEEPGEPAERPAAQPPGDVS